MSGEHLDWIGGQWCAAASGLYFERADKTDRAARTERWPRSNAVDVARAIEACARAAPRWSARSSEERRALLVRAAEALESKADVAPRLARELGLRPDEFAGRHADELYRLREALELLSDEASAEGVGFFQAHWSDLAAGLLMRVAPKLVAGQSLVLLADPHLSPAAEFVAQCLEAAGLPAGVVALLHDDANTSLHAGIASSGLAWLRLKGHDERLETLRSRLEERAGAKWSWWPVRARSQVVTHDEDPALAAATVVEQSIGRAATISAQFPGQTARVLCHQRLFSKFSEELLARLGASPDAVDPVPAIEADLELYVRGAWELGLDEGATPLVGWEHPAPVNGAARGDARGAASAPLASATWPCLFTNVEPHSRLAELGRPAPVLRLIRVPTDEVARQLAHELDHPPTT